MNRILQLSINSSVQLHRLALKSNGFLRNPTILCGQTRIYGSNKLPIKEEDKYVTVYKYSSIKYMSAISSSKKFHFLAVALLTPITAVLEYNAVLDPPTAIITAYLGLTWGVCMCLVSWIFKGTIGIIYVSNDYSKIKVSSLDFWGGRIDTVMSSDDWVPLSEVPSGYFRTAFLTTRQYSNNKKMRLFHGSGKIYDQKIFDLVIGLA